MVMYDVYYVRVVLYVSLYVIIMIILINVTWHLLIDGDYDYDYDAYD